MLHLILDASHTNDAVEAQSFFTTQWWQMNLMNAINNSMGVAQFLAHQHGLAKGNWHIASPIHWEATHNDAMIVLDGQAGVDENELIHFFQVFQGFVERDDLPIEKLSSGVWLFDAKNLLECTLPSLNSVMHRSLHEYLLMMPNEWRTWFTEVQMLFHCATANKATTINGVWPWGGGEFKLTTPIYQLGDFPGIEAKNWSSEMKLPHTGVLLISEQHAKEFEEIFNKKFINRVPVTWWWNNKTYQTKPKTIWKHLKSWFSHAN